MTKQKTKKNPAKKILIILLSAIIFNIFTPAIIGHFVNQKGYEQTAYAEPEPTAPGPAQSGTTQPAPADKSDNEEDKPEDEQKPAAQVAEKPAAEVAENTPTTDPVAAPPSDTAPSSEDFTQKEFEYGAGAKEQLASTISFLNAIQSAINRFIWPLLVMIGGLMDNSLLFGHGMGETLRDIWIPIRNLVNILFVIALVGIALYNVLGIGEEGGNYALKSILPKLIVGIILVNFSFLGIKVFLDSINLLTVSIFALPDQVSEGLGSLDTDKDVIKRMCVKTQGEELKILNESNGEKKLIARNAQRILEGTSAEYGYKLKDVIKNVDHTYITASNLIDEKFFTQAKQTILSQQSAPPNGTKPADAAKANEALEKEFTSFRASVEKKLNNRFCVGFQLGEEGTKLLNRFNARSAPMAFILNMSNIVFYEDMGLSIDTFLKFSVSTIFSVILYVVYIASFLALFIVLLARLVVLWLAIALSPILVLGIAVPAFKEKISGFGEITDQFIQNAIAPLGIAISMSVGWIMLKAIQATNFDSTSLFSSDLGLPVERLSSLHDIIVATGTIAVVWLGVFTAASKSIASGVTDAIKGGVQSAGKFLALAPIKHANIIPIKLPGKPEEPYSIAEVLEAAKYATADKPANRLRDAAFPGSKSPSDIISERDPQKKMELLKQHPEYLDDKNLRKHLLGLSDSDKENFLKTITDHGVRNSIKDLLKGIKDEDDPKWGKIKTILEKQKTIPTPKPTPPATGNGSTQQTNQTQNKNINISTGPINTYNGNNITANSQEHSTLSNVRTNLGTELKKQTPNIDILKQELNKLKQLGNGQTTDAVKGLIGQQAYTELTKIIPENDLLVEINPAPSTPPTPEEE